MSQSRGWTEEAGLCRDPLEAMHAIKVRDRWAATCSVVEMEERESIQDTFRSKHQECMGVCV